MKQLATSLQQLQNVYPPSPPKVTDKRHKQTNNSIVIEKPGSVCGVYHFAWWYAIGQSETKPPVLSNDLIKTAAILNGGVQFFKNIAQILQVIGIIYHVIDPQNYWNALQRVLITRKDGSWEPYTTNRRFPFHGVAVLKNLRVQPHNDSGDRKDGSALMIYSGEFKGAYLALPQLKIKLEFRRGDIIVFKSSLLEHFLTEFEGDRTVLVFFTHQNIWDNSKP